MKINGYIECENLFKHTFSFKVSIIIDKILYKFYTKFFDIKCKKLFRHTFYFKDSIIIDKILYVLFKKNYNKKNIKINL